MWPNLQEIAILAKFTEEILNAKLHFLRSEISRIFEKNFGRFYRRSLFSKIP